MLYMICWRGMESRDEKRLADLNFVDSVSSVDRFD